MRFFTILQFKNLLFQPVNDIGYLLYHMDW